MSAAVALLQGCEVAGIELFLDNGRLRYRAQPGAYTEDLKQRVGAHKAEIVAELSSQAATPAAGDLIHWSSLTPRATGRDTPHHQGRGSFAYLPARA